MSPESLRVSSQNMTAKGRDLQARLKKLLDQGVIDQRLYEWGETLRRHRNLGAHASGAHIAREDAQDLFDFTNAICDYVFVLSAKFSRFQARDS